MKNQPEVNYNLFGEVVVYDVAEPPKDEKIHKHDMWDWIGSIKDTKVDLRIQPLTTTKGTGKNKVTVTIPPDPSMKTFDPYMVIQGLSQNKDIAPIAHMMNERSHLSKDMQYSFLLNAIPRTKSYDKWTKKTVDKRVKQMVESLSMSNRDAQEIAYVFTEDEIDNELKLHKEQERCKSKKSKR
ncbi:clamp loader A subunit [Vibrio phage 3.058.O._10N.286.46.B8]|nr:clamp loader A subunit [Vibrio phage 2.058.O._10N.286.46.B8]AUS03182.1 clamp loader A subunit [Vibrio phage 3.058.O._10N.286.46.B8]